MADFPVPDGEAEESVVEEYPTDVRVVRVDRGETSNYQVDVPLGFSPRNDDGDVVFTVPIFDSLRDARLFADVWDVVGGFDYNAAVGGEGVPPRVAAAPNRVVAAYLLTQSFDTEDVMRILDVKRATVHSFTSRVRSDAEEVREDAATTS